MVNVFTFVPCYFIKSHLCVMNPYATYIAHPSASNNNNPPHLQPFHAVICQRSRERKKEMLRAKKKKEEEAAAAAKAAASGASASTSSSNAMEVDGHNGGAPEGGSTVSILGIGGKSVKSGQAKGRRRQPAELRIQKDLAEVELGTAANIVFPNPNDLTDFQVEVLPESGFWTGAKFLFSFRFPAEYPHTPPKVTCLTRILHPNIDWEVRSSYF